MTLESKIIGGLERLSEVFKTLLWEKAKVHGLSPIQIQILLFVRKHSVELCSVSHLAKEFNLTKATISDAVKVLINKNLLEKDFTPADNRRYNLLITRQGENLTQDLLDYSEAISKALSYLDDREHSTLYQVLTKLIYRLNQLGVIQVQRTCFNCRYYNGNKTTHHFCNLLEKPLATTDIQLDCPEFEEFRAA